jgi:hypothetical protein
LAFVNLSVDFSAIVMKMLPEWKRSANENGQYKNSNYYYEIASFLLTIGTKNNFNDLGATTIFRIVPEFHAATPAAYHQF